MQVHTDLLARCQGLVPQVVPVMKILHQCISKGPPHPEELNQLLEVRSNQLFCVLHYIIRLFSS